MDRLTRVSRLFLLVLVLAQTTTPVSGVSTCTMESGGAAEACCCCNTEPMVLEGPMVGAVGCCHVDIEGDDPTASPAVTANESQHTIASIAPVTHANPFFAVHLYAPDTGLTVGARAHAPPFYTLYCTYLI
jgi:hypothetical protein